MPAVRRSAVPLALPIPVICELPAFHLPVDTRAWPEVHLPGWQIVRPLSAGAQAFTYLVAPEGSADDAPLAVAKLYRTHGYEGYPFSLDEQRWRVLREVTALQVIARAGCTAVPEVLDYGLHAGRSEHAWLVQPFYRGGPLRWSDGVRHHYLSELKGNLDRVLEIATTLARALAAMHAHPMRVLHRDLNLGNVLLTKPGGAAVLADFGSVQIRGFPSRPAEEGAILSGTGSWRAPELEREGYGEATPAADVFQLGGLIYEAISGGRVLPPARGWGADAPLTKPEHALADLVEDTRWPGLEMLLAEMLALLPEERPTAEEVVGRLEGASRVAVGG
jgi:serine/threonine protein kinase